jgi:glycosyltransferase involved in cell wall biosynthesis
MPKKYNIAIDISPLSDGNANRGVGYYTKQLVNALQSEVKTNPLYDNFSINLITNHSSLITNYDLIHYPYFDPFYLTLPTKKNIPQIITIHDLIPLQYPQYFPPGIRGKIKWYIQKNNACQSDYIITVSQYSRQVISKILHCPLEKIFVTQEAGDSYYQPKYNSFDKQRIIKKYNLPQKFVLNNGDINWNKNIPNLIDACISLKYPLVIVGKQALDVDQLKLEEPSLARPVDLFRYLLNLPSPQLKHITRLNNLFKDPLIRRLGYVPDEDLPIIYNLATIYCQPSYAEGFGLSLVKAMQTGTPIVYSQNSSLPEVMADTGISFDPFNQHSLIEKLKLLWNNKSLRLTQHKLCLNRATHFSWKKTAIQTLAVYNLALTK